MRTESARNESDRTIFIFIAIAVVFSRVAALFVCDIWYDEGALFHSLYWDILPKTAPPLYWLFMRSWTAVFGNSLLALRVPSAVFSVGTVFPLYLFARRYAGQRIACLAAALYCFSPFQLWYAQEATLYALSLFLGVCFVYYAYDWSRDGEPRSAVLAVITGVLFCFTDYINTLFCLPLIGYVTLRGSIRKRVGIWLFYAAVGTVVLLPAYAGREQIYPYVSWITPVSFPDVVILVNNYFIGYTFDAMLQKSFLVLSSVLLVIAGAEIFNKKNRLLCFLCFLPLIMIYGVSAFVVPIYLSRKLLVISPLFYVLVLIGINRRQRLLRTALLSAIFAVVFWAAFLFYTHVPSFSENQASNVFHKGVPFKYPYVNALTHIRDSVGPDDIILYSNFDMRFPLFYYAHRWQWEIDCYHALFAGGDENEVKPLEHRIPAELTRALVVYLGEGGEVSRDFMLKQKDAVIFWWMVDAYRAKGYFDVAPHTEENARKRFNRFIVENDRKERIRSVSLHHSLFLEKRMVDHVAPERIWFVASSWNRHALDPMNAAIRSWMHEQYVCQEQMTIDGIIIEVFVPGPGSARVRRN